MKYHKSPLVVALLLGVTTAGLTTGLHAQPYEWAQRTGGDPNGAVVNSGTNTSWTWGWNPGGAGITGTVGLTRVGAGRTYVSSENFATTLGAATEFDGPDAAAGNTLGGISGIYHFTSHGETLGALPDSGGLTNEINDTNPEDRSNTIVDFRFDPGYYAPQNTLITLWDPGARLNEYDGPSSYTFSAYLDGIAVDTSNWALTTLDIYAPGGNATTGIDWNGASGVLSIPHYFDGNETGNYPDTVTYLDTGDTTFNRLVLEVNGLSYDTFAVGFGASVPEPSSALLVGLAGVVFISRRGRRG